MNPSIETADSWTAYQAAVEHNRAVFVQDHEQESQLFELLDCAFNRYLAAIRDYRTANEKTHVSFAPVVLLLQRQVRFAFQAISAYQPFQAWLTMRPGLELLLIAGKWLDDRSNVETWRHRDADWQKYQRTFSGKQLRSKSLPQSDRLQSVLTHINDRYAHPNPDYCYRHLATTAGVGSEVTIHMYCFDRKADLVAHLLAFLHLVAVSQDAAAGLLEAELPGLKIERAIPQICSSLEQRAFDLAAASKSYAGILEHLGTWSL